MGHHNHVADSANQGEQHKQRTAVTSLSTLEVMTPLVLYMAEVNTIPKSYKLNITDCSFNGKQCMLILLYYLTKVTERNLTVKTKAIVTEFVSTDRVAS